MPLVKRMDAVGGDPKVDKWAKTRQWMLQLAPDLKVAMLKAEKVAEYTQVLKAENEKLKKELREKDELVSKLTTAKEKAKRKKDKLKTEIKRLKKLDLKSRPKRKAPKEAGKSAAAAAEDKDTPSPPKGIKKIKKEMKEQK